MGTKKTNTSYNRFCRNSNYFFSPSIQSERYRVPGNQSLHIEQKRYKAALHPLRKTWPLHLVPMLPLAD